MEDNKYCEEKITAKIAAEYQSMDRNDIYEDFVYSNLIKPKYADEMKIKLTTFVLIYDSHIKYEIIKTHIDIILSRRKNKDGNIIYWLSTYLNKNGIIENKTNIYLDLCTKYETRRKVFDLKILGDKIIPQMRLIEKEYKDMVLQQIVNLDINHPYEENKIIFENLLNENEECHVDDNISQTKSSITCSANVRSKFSDNTLITEKIEFFEMNISRQDSELKRQNIELEKLNNILYEKIKSYESIFEELRNEIKELKNKKVESSTKNIKKFSVKNNEITNYSTTSKKGVDFNPKFNELICDVSNF